MDVADRKCLIAFFSRRGQNYRGGRIVELEVGNTEVVAGLIQELVGGDLFRIEGIAPYPRDYGAATEQAKRELRGRVRPPLRGAVEGFGSYELVFLGYPNWWGTAPMPLFTFLEGRDFSGKIILPFCTHEGSGLGSSERDIARSCPGARLLPGLAIPGSEIDSAKARLAAWLKSL